MDEQNQYQNVWIGGGKIYDLKNLRYWMKINDLIMLYFVFRNVNYFLKDGLK